jgi:hypothetical protein
VSLTSTDGRGSGGTSSIVGKSSVRAAEFESVSCVDGWSVAASSSPLATLMYCPLPVGSEKCTGMSMLGAGGFGGGTELAIRLCACFARSCGLGARDSSSLSFDSASRNSVAVWYRRSRVFASAFSTSASKPCGIAGLISRIARGVPDRICTSSAL